MYNIFSKNLFLRVVLIASLISFLWLSGIQKVNSQFLGNPLSSLEKVISNLENTIGSLKQTTENYTQKINEYETKIQKYDKEINQKMSKFQKEIEKQITNIAREVTEEIENISAKIESKIQEIEDRIRQSFTTLTWGLLIGDSIVSALFSGLATWWVVRRLEKDIEKRLTRLNEVLAVETLDNIQELTDEIKKLRAGGESNPNIS